MIVAAKISIQGRVQGVGFRYAASKEARRLQLKGWVRNEADGSVHLRIQGDEEACHRFIAWCHRGPGYAWVERVQPREEVLSDLLPFQVRH